MKIGTRGSPLALAQAKEVARLIAEAGGPETEIVVLSTTGDQVQDRPLSEIGGKGLFTKELDAALLDGRIDLAAHSMKDVATVLPDRIALAAVLEREDVRDAFLSPKAASLDDLPEGAVVGTASLRRQAQLKWRRPDLEAVLFRGNVQTRLRKLSEDVADATFLALAGLKRLGMADLAQSVLPVDHMLPACAQGAVGVAIREGDDAAAAVVKPLDHAETALRVTAERAFLRRLDGSCRTPIAGLAELDGEQVRFRGEILLPDGSKRWFAERRGPAAQAEALALDAAEELLAASGGVVSG